MVNIDRMVTEFIEFVRIPSPCFKERQFADRVKQGLAELGIKCQEDKTGAAIGGNCGNLFARVPGDKKRPTILLSAHLDTVETGAVVIEPKVKNGIISSVGNTILGADDKTALVAIFEALRVIKENNLPHNPIELVFSVCEEQGLLGIKHFDCSKLKAKAGFVLDAGGAIGGVVTRAPAYDCITASITGKASHAGAAPEEGISAIQIAAKALAKMRLGRIDDKTTANVGVISGGTARNVVPERCQIWAEARSQSYASLRKQVQHMLKCLHDEAKAGGAKIEIEVEREFEAVNTPASALPVKLAKQAATSLGFPFSTRATGGGADTAIISAAGIPCVTINMGSSDAHSINEKLPVEELRKLGEMTLALVTMAG